MEDRHPWLSWQTGVHIVNPREPQATGKMPSSSVKSAYSAVKEFLGVAEFAVSA
jgi:hypothetical protein